MIRYKDDIFEDYFIDKNTGIITRRDGSEVETRIHGPYLCIKKEGKLNGLPIHVIQVHTHIGYSPEMSKLHVHHLDDNPLNNALDNLVLLTNSEHQKLHCITNRRKFWGGKPQDGENNNMFGKKYKWINDGSQCKFLFEGEELPDGWKYGRILTDKARKSISENGKRLADYWKDPEYRKRLSDIRKGQVWWNNGIENKKTIECPGEGWKKGRINFTLNHHKWTDEERQIISRRMKGIKRSDEVKKRESDYFKGMIFWNNGEVNKRSKEYPGPGWKKGRLNRR